MRRTNTHTTRPRSRIPRYLSADQVTRMIKSTRNAKHRAMLALMYGCGLRLSEVLNLRTSDIDHANRTITIYGKGAKYRLGYLHLGVFALLMEYEQRYKIAGFYFQGEQGGQYSRRSLQKVVHAAGIRAGIQFPVHAHMLRHSYATHCLDSGCNLFDLKNALGHVHLSSTEIYLHCSTAHLRRMPDLLH